MLQLRVERGLALARLFQRLGEIVLAGEPLDDEPQQLGDLRLDGVKLGARARRVALQLLRSARVALGRQGARVASALMLRPDPPQNTPLCRRVKPLFGFPKTTSLAVMATTSMTTFDGFAHPKAFRDRCAGPVTRRDREALVHVDHAGASPGGQLDSCVAR